MQMRTERNTRDERGDRQQEKGLFNPSIQAQHGVCGLPVYPGAGQEGPFSYPSLLGVDSDPSLACLAQTCCPSIGYGDTFLASHSATRRGPRLAKGPGTVGRPLVSSQTHTRSQRTNI